MDDDYPDLKPDVVKLESELILEDDIETDANFSGSCHHVPSATFAERSSPNFVPRFSTTETVPSTSQDVTNVMVKIKEEMTEEVTPSAGPCYELSCEIGNAPCPKLKPVVHPEGTCVNSVNDSLSATRIKSENKFVLDWAPHFNEEKAEDEVPLAGTSVDVKQHCSSSTVLSPVLEGCSMFSEGRVNVKIEDDLTEDGDVFSANQLHLDFPEANQENLVEGMDSEKMNFKFCSEDKEYESFEVPTPCADEAEKAENKTEYFDENMCLNSEQCPLQSKLKLDPKHGSFINSPSGSSLIADSSIKHTKKGSAENHTGALLNENSPFDVCTATSSTYSEFTSPRVALPKEKQFSCEQCSAKFARKHYLKTHLTIHSNERAFSCDRCPAQFKIKSNLSQHLLIHANKKAFSCDQCAAQFTRKTHLTNHLLIHTNERGFPCDLCSAQFKKKGDLKRHLSNNCNEKAFSCNQCAAQFKTKGNLKQHLLVHSAKKVFCCNQCSTQFKRKGDLKKHSLIHCDEKAFSCDRCLSQFKVKSNLSQHLLIHTNKKAFSCDQCAAQFTRKNHLTSHLLIHTNEKEFPCDLCSAQFKRKSDLKLHLLNNCNEKAFPCNQCTAQFKTKGNLKQHLSVHSTEKAVCCNQCSAQFKRKGDLKRHLLIHSDEKAFSCDRCPARFKIKGNLNQHLLIHSNKKAFSCDQCAAQFTRKNHLKQHLLIHTNEKAFSSDLCAA